MISHRPLVKNIKFRQKKGKEKIVGKYFFFKTGICWLYEQPDENILLLFFISVFTIFFLWNTFSAKSRKNWFFFFAQIFTQPWIPGRSHRQTIIYNLLKQHHELNFFHPFEPSRVIKVFSHRKSHYILEVLTKKLEKKM